MSSKGIGQVANYKPLARCGMEELAYRQRIIKPSGGVLFARNDDGEEKEQARQRILDLFCPGKWDRPLHILTMPGLQWRFERKLLATREVGWMRAAEPRRTWFTGFENDRSVYFAAAAQMPGVGNPNALIKAIKPVPYAELGVKTRYAAFFFADVDDAVKYNWDSGWDAAWLDFTGPLTTARLKVIQRFFELYVRDTLIITALKARWDYETSDMIETVGGYPRWLCKHLDGEILHYLEYQDTSPMAQIAIRH